jgi:hypothetical protein
VIASPATAGGFLFEFPLLAGPKAANKILWAMRLPRSGSSLVLTAHPLGASAPVVTESRPDNSSPGEIYPDGLDVPSAGCWQVSLSWGGNHAEIDLNYGN